MTFIGNRVPADVISFSEVILMQAGPLTQYDRCPSTEGKFGCRPQVDEEITRCDDEELGQSNAEAEQ